VLSFEADWLKNRTFAMIGQYIHETTSKLAKPEKTQKMISIVKH